MMKSLVKPFIVVEGYESVLSVRETEKAIHEIKRTFEGELSSQLNLSRVSAPLFVLAGNGINDNLNGSERPVSFDAIDIDEGAVEIVHSLAKWKRMALAKYDFAVGEGLYTDMNAIRRDEVLDNLHSLYVDQWDWEKVITAEQRTLDTLIAAVNAIYAALRATEDKLAALFPALGRLLPENVHVVSSQELEDRYPELTPKEREDAAAKQYGAVFVTQIGGVLRSGLRHDGRSPDYDDWNLNGDLLVWHPTLEVAFELSSMGIRVDEASLLEQLHKAGAQDRRNLEFHRKLLNGELPYTIGGGIGQSRLSMYLLRKAHIGEVQVSVWPVDMAERAKQANMHLL